jgi:hypothetical protein
MCLWQREECNTAFATIHVGLLPGGAAMWGLSLGDGAALLVGVVLLVITGPVSHLLSPWLISSIMVGWVFGRVMLHHIDRSVESSPERETHA